MRIQGSWVCRISIGSLLWVGTLSSLQAGPYSAALNDPSNSYDAPVPGFLGPDGIGMARLVASFDGNNDPIYQNPGNYVNPIFFDWATSVTQYFRADEDSPFSSLSLALGPVTGNNFDVVSLGDLSALQISSAASPGSITLQLAKPIQNLSGPDFVVFENGFISTSNQGGFGVGGISAELAYVEVSADGVNFVRFPATSLTTAVVGPYGTIDPTNVYNLAGKHTNSYGKSWGTPFDLTQVGLLQIRYIRLVDIPGNGAFKDQAGRSIYDAWLTSGSGGFDLEALGSISTRMTYGEWPPLATLDPVERAEDGDPDHDGLSNLLEYAFARLPNLADAADTLPSCRLVVGAGGMYSEFRFVRDERLIDLKYEVQVSSSLQAGAWTTLATSTAGAALIQAAGDLSTITDSAANWMQGVGVVRVVTLRSATPVSAGYKQFFRVKVSRIPLGG